MIVVTLFALVALFSRTRAQLEQYALTASSSYRMVISTAEEELGSVATKILQEATAEHLLEQSILLSVEQEQPHYRSIEVVVQAMEIVPGETRPRLRFFVLASTQTAGEFDSQARRQRSLNELVEYSFRTQDRIELLLLRIRVQEAENRDTINAKASAQLQAINTIELYATSLTSPTSAPLSNDTSPNGNDVASTSTSLSKLDIVLIGVSSFILLGIMWMVFVHHMDRGYIENQRMRVLNLQQQRSNEEDRKRQRHEEKVQLRNEEDTSAVAVQLTPSTQSSLSLSSLRKDASAFPSLRSTSIPPGTEYHLSTAAVLGDTSTFQESSDQVHYATSNLTADPSGDLYPRSSYSSNGNSSSSLSQASLSSDGMQTSKSHVTLGIAEPFDQQNWFRRSRSDGSSSPSSKESTTDDVFQVGVETVESDSENDDNGRDPQAMSEWLQSIHVVHTPTKPNATTAVADVSSLGHASLEQSMVSSAVSPPKNGNSSALSL